MKRFVQILIAAGLPLALAVILAVGMVSPAQAATLPATAAQGTISGTLQLQGAMSGTVSFWMTVNEFFSFVSTVWCGCGGSTALPPTLGPVETPAPGSTPMPPAPTKTPVPGGLPPIGEHPPVPAETCSYTAGDQTGLAPDTYKTASELPANTNMLIFQGIKGRGQYDVYWTLPVGPFQAGTRVWVYKCPAGSAAIFSAAVLYEQSWLQAAADGSRSIVDHGR